MAEREQDLPKKFTRRELLVNALYGVSALFAAESLVSSSQTFILNREGYVIGVSGEPQSVQEKIDRINEERDVARTRFILLAMGGVTASVLALSKAISLEEK